MNRIHLTGRACEISAHINKVISQNGNIGWIDNINEEYCGFIKEVKPLQKKNK
jgi:hypothetical protein